MKLPDFIQDDALNGLRKKMGAPLGDFSLIAEKGFVLTCDEIIRLTTQGIEIPISEVKVLPDGTIAYKNSRIIIYIRDIVSFNNNNRGLPKFHIANCDTLEKMRSNDRFERYVVSTREDGLFVINVVQSNGMPIHREERLLVCQNCLTRLNWERFGFGMNKAARLDFVRRFSIAKFFERYKKTFILDTPASTDKDAPINNYPNDFYDIAERIKRVRGYCCEKCKINLIKHQRYLHAHHKNGQKNDSRPENIAVLCVACHAEEFGHAHIKNAPYYNDFLIMRESKPMKKIAPISSGNGNSPALVQSAKFVGWERAAREIANTHGLSVEDSRGAGGNFWVYLNSSDHPASDNLKSIGFSYSEKREGFWRKE
ncbi:MAG: HNH endonuclease [Magnetococcales bacterium]|nr:HNH endonuclease [Magnetococcales bacterium]